MANFIYIDIENGEYRLVNVDHVRVVDQIRDGHCRLIFDNNFIVDVDGPDANELALRFLNESLLPDGTAVSGTGLCNVVESPGPIATLSNDSND